MTEKPAHGSKFPAGLKAYYGYRRFLLLAQSYLADRGSKPYKRPSATLILACSGSLSVDAGSGESFDTRAVLIAPNVLRRHTEAENADVVIFDFPAVSAEFAVVQDLLVGKEYVCFDFDRFSHLVPQLEAASQGDFAPLEVRDLFTALIEALCGRRPQYGEVDKRIVRTMDLIDKLSLDEISIPQLAEKVHLSDSRLSALFKSETGFSIAQYRRWVAVWKAIEQWHQGSAWTDLAHAAGFSDQAHLNRAFNEVFGWNPSAATDPQQLTLVRYD